MFNNSIVDVFTYPILNVYLIDQKTTSLVTREFEKAIIMILDIYAFAYHKHCVKSVQIRSFFRSVFSRIWIRVRIQYEYEKMQTKKPPYLDTFHTVKIISK